MSSRVVWHEERCTKRADDLDLISLLQITQIVRPHASDRLAFMVNRYTLDCEREIVVIRPLAVARTRDRVLARVVRPPDAIVARRNDANRLALQYREG